jgi:hypothetical protein
LAPRPRRVITLKMPFATRVMGVSRYVFVMFRSSPANGPYAYRQVARSDSR